MTPAVFTEMTVETEVAVGAYTAHPDWTNHDNTQALAILEIDLGLESGKDYKIVQNNNALVLSGGIVDTPNVGIKTMSIDNASGAYLTEKMSIVLANGEDATIALYEVDGSTETLIAVYSITNVKVTEDEDDTEYKVASKETEVRFVKDAYAVESVKSQKLTYVDEDEVYGVNLGTIKIDDDAEVYDLTNGFVVGDYDDLEAAANEPEATIYVVPFDTNADKIADILVIVE